MGSVLPNSARAVDSGITAMSAPLSTSAQVGKRPRRTRLQAGGLFRVPGDALGKKGGKRFDVVVDAC